MIYVVKKKKSTSRVCLGIIQWDQGKSIELVPLGS